MAAGAIEAEIGIGPTGLEENAAVGVQYQPWKHVGFALDYQYFKLAVDVDKSDWRGASNITYQGPFISVSANW